METFDHLLYWTLKVGTHRFPGPDGGTCINEAALVAAGFPYRPIRTVEQMPDCYLAANLPPRALAERYGQ